MSEAQVKKTGSYFERGMEQYKQENYKASLPLFIQSREENPSSSLTAYYLGLNYIKLGNDQKAIEQFKDAVTYLPKMKEALIELIHCLYRSDELEEAKKWIAEAESEGIRQAQISFLKGLVLLKEKKFDAALELFQKAKILDPSLEQASQYQIGVIHLKREDLSRAEKAFNEVIDLQPASDLAQYADEYIDAVRKRQEALRPWKISYKTTWQYDDNVILQPENSSLASDITKQSDWRIIYDLKTEYTRRFEGPFRFKARYDFSYSKQNRLGYYNTMIHSANLQPTLYFKKSTLSFPASYSHTIVDDRSYLSNHSLEAVYNFTLGKVQMGQTYLRYDYKDYLWTSSLTEEDPDANELRSGLGWFLFYGKTRGFCNMRYRFNRNWTKGKNGEYTGNRIDALVLVPVLDKLDVWITGRVDFHDFVNTHTAFEIEREDELYTGSVFIAYKFYKEHEFQLQFTFTKNDSNISEYTYSQSIYSTGIQIEF